MRVAGNDSDEEGDKKLARTLVRAQLTRFLDELSHAYRARWQRALRENAGGNGAERAAIWASGLDQIRKTRHYILRNANANLALDALFLRLVGAQRAAKTPTARTPAMRR